jgi:peptidase E
MSTPLKPVFLVADSRLLFSTDHARPISQRIRDAVEREQPTAAYIGASNGDDPAFFGVFEAAMDLVGAGDRRIVRADFARDDVSFLESADIILLAGGDPALGWRAMEMGGVVQSIRDRYRAGAVLIGVSAGAVLLGEKGWRAGDDGRFELFDAFRLIPTIIDAHDEARGWDRLKRAVAASGRSGIGLPFGSGLVCHPDMTLEPVRRPVVQFHPEPDGDLGSPPPSA